MSSNKRSPHYLNPLELLSAKMFLTANKNVTDSKILQTTTELMMRWKHNSNPYLFGLSKFSIARWQSELSTIRSPCVNSVRCIRQAMIITGNHILKGSAHTANANKARTHVRTQPQNNIDKNQRKKESEAREWRILKNQQPKVQSVHSFTRYQYHALSATFQRNFVDPTGSVYSNRMWIYDLW